MLRKRSAIVFPDRAFPYGDVLKTRASLIRVCNSGRDQSYVLAKCLIAPI